MKLRNFRLFLALVMPLLFILSFVGWNLQNQPSPAYSFTVKIPKEFNPNFTDAELWEYVESGHSLPISEFKKRNLPIPHYHKFLTVSLEKDKKLKINMEECGNLEDTSLLTQKLAEVFHEREQMCVYEENSNKVVKDVIIRIPRSTKYGDVVKVIDAVKSSGADPIVLQIDDLPE